MREVDEKLSIKELGPNSQLTESYTVVALLPGTFDGPKADQFHII